MSWKPLVRLTELAEERLINAILDGEFPIDSNLPAERTLAVRLGITRPTLREALQRMARDGWVEIRHGKPTRVRNYWQEGNLAVLAAIARRGQYLSSDFVTNLLAVRLLLAPTYTRLAVERHPVEMLKYFNGYTQTADDPQAFTDTDWQLHRQLTIASENPVFTLILNGFKELYQEMGLRYFQLPEARAHSRCFYQSLLDCTQSGDYDRIEAITRRVMVESLDFWRKLASFSESSVQE